MSWMARMPSANPTWARAGVAMSRRRPTRRRLAGAAALVDLDEAALVDLDAGAVEAEVVGVGPAPDRHDHDVDVEVSPSPKCTVVPPSLGSWP
jgi:hypothetical protein